MRLFNYIKKYSDFYLSKYSVTKRKFEDILKQKLKKDFFKKKISTEDYSSFVEQIDGVVDYYYKIGWGTGAYRYAYCSKCGCVLGYTGGI